MRLRVTAENLANMDATGTAPGADPYRRRLVAFSSELDRTSGVPLVTAQRTVADPSPFRLEFNPGHPAADSNGYVKLPNVSMIVEMADMREASRSYEANLQVIKQARDMISMTIDLLRSQG